METAPLTELATSIEPPAVYPALPAEALAQRRSLASRYIWWKIPEEAMLYPHRIAAQVMNIGDWDDVCDMEDATGQDYLRHVLQHSEVGQLNARSSHLWHLWLGLARYGAVPVPPFAHREIRVSTFEPTSA